MQILNRLYISIQRWRTHDFLISFCILQRGHEKASKNIDFVVSLPAHSKNMASHGPLLFLFSVLAFSFTTALQFNAASKTTALRGRQLSDFAITPVNLTYHQGPIMSEGINLYVIYYGNWSTSTKNVVEGFLNSLGDESNATLTPNLKQWWSILAGYNDSFGNYINSNVSLKQTYEDSSYSAGISSLHINRTSDAQSKITNALEHQLPVDDNGVYIIMTSKEVSVSTL